MPTSRSGITASVLLSSAHLYMHLTCPFLRRDALLLCSAQAACLWSAAGVSLKQCLSAQQEQEHFLMCLMSRCCMWYSQSHLRMQTYIHNQATYISQLFHHVNVRDLPFGVPIYYK